MTRPETDKLEGEALKPAHLVVMDLLAEILNSKRDSRNTMWVEKAEADILASILQRSIIPPEGREQISTQLDDWMNFGNFLMVEMSTLYTTS